MTISSLSVAIESRFEVFLTRNVELYKRYKFSGGFLKSKTTFRIDRIHLKLQYWLIAVSSTLIIGVKSSLKSNCQQFLIGLFVYVDLCVISIVRWMMILAVIKKGLYFLQALLLLLTPATCCRWSSSLLQLCNLLELKNEIIASSYSKCVTQYRKVYQGRIICKAWSNIYIKIWSKVWSEISEKSEARCEII